jgi:hypothetical protein
MRKDHRPYVAALIALLSSSIAHAIPVTWEATGTIDSTFSNGGDSLPFTAAVGDAFTYRFTFEDATADSYFNPADTTVGLYRAMLSATVTVNGIEFAVPLLQVNSAIVAEDKSTGDRFDASATDDTIGNSLGYGAGMFLRTNFDSTVLTSDAIPAAPPDPLAFNVRMFSFQHLIAFDEESFQYIGSSIQGTVDGLRAVSPTSVPEPGTFGLPGLGIAGAGLARRRRRSKR